MKNNIEEYEEIIFEKIKHIDENGNEYWEARELQKVLEYVKWKNFEKVIINAKEACKNSGYIVEEQLTEIGKLSKRANNANVEIKNYKLSRYACYLIVQNADPKKVAIAIGQTYFAIQTRRQELSENEYDLLSEDEKRFYQRNLTKKGNYSLQKLAKKAGVKNMNQFHNAGYKGLYNGETADDIFKRKGLRYREDILDNMSSDEFAINHFRIVQTKQKIQNENIKGESKAKIVHNKIGKIVRNAIKLSGGTLPENLPTPSKSLKQLEKKEKKKLGFLR